MDAGRFDTLARNLGAPAARRGVLGVLLGLGVAATGLLLDSDEGAARRKRHGRQRSHRPGKGKDNRKGKRKGKGGKGGIGSGEWCGSTSDCPTGETCCSATCVDLQTDNDNCGACGTACEGQSPTCVAGQCQCATIICSGTGCCPSKTDVCDQNDECCAPKTCADYPSGTCGPQDDGCGGKTECPCCPGTPCDCPAGRTICDDITGPKVYCPDSDCGCVAHAGDGHSICYSSAGGECFSDSRICSTDADCEEQDLTGFVCVLTGQCAGLACYETMCIEPCSPGSPG